MQNHAEQIANATSGGAYSISGLLMLDNWIPFLDKWIPVLDNHAGAIGVMLGVMTFIVNFIFQIINARSRQDAA